MVVGFVMSGYQATAMIDSYGAASARWGIENIDGENLRNDLNPTKNLGLRLPPDVMKKDGTQWEKPSWKIAPATQAPAAHEGAQH